MLLRQVLCPQIICFRVVFHINLLLCMCGKNLTCPQGKCSLNCNELFNLDKRLKRVSIIKSCSRLGMEACEELCAQIDVVRWANFRVNFHYFSFVFKLSGLCLMHCSKLFTRCLVL